MDTLEALGDHRLHAARPRAAPEPYSLPAITTSGTPAARYFAEASKIGITEPSSRQVVQPPPVPGASAFLSRTLANVPRIMTSWLPRRDPYELKSFGATPCAMRYWPAGLSTLMDPAGEIWSVVMLSPSSASARAPWMSAGASGCPHR